MHQGVEIHTLIDVRKKYRSDCNRYTNIGCQLFFIIETVKFSRVLEVLRKKTGQGRTF